MHVHALQQVVADRLHGLHAQSVDVRRRVITREGRQVNARHSFQVPGCLEKDDSFGSDASTQAQISCSICS